MAGEINTQSLLTPPAIKFWTSLRTDMGLSHRIPLLEKRILFVRWASRLVSTGEISYVALRKVFNLPTF
jgi:hypothetical protein